jgi:(heptosyl)LPS beta-1,4-glucosyltransferase
MDKISATIITRNEEHNIERCLCSLQGVVDEIIVVDSHSDDHTLDICRKYGCKITSREFSGFGSQRQYATGLTSNNYILSIDADEVISEEMREAILKLKEEGFTHRVYSAEVITYFCGEPVHHSGWHPNDEIRLFNKRYANWNLHDLGERITFSDSLIPQKIGGNIHHYRCANLDELNHKLQREASLRAKIIASKCKRILPTTPTWRSLKEWLNCHFRQAAILDGHKGRMIANYRRLTAYKAYKEARDIIKQRS